MSRDYGRIYTAFWKNSAIRGLDDRGKLLANYLITSPHSNLIGAYLLPDAYIADDLEWPFETVRKTVSELEKIGFCQRFKDGRHVVICKFLEWNTIENPNVAKAAEKLFDQLPDDQCLYHVINGLRRYAEHFKKAFPDGQSTVLKRFGKQSRNQEQEQKKEQEEEQDSLLPAVAGEPVELLAFQFYVAATNMLDWSQPKDLNAERKAKLLARIDQAGGLDGWCAAIRRAVESPFLRGEKGRSKAHANWRPNLDFFLQKKSFTQLLEGQYDDRENLCSDNNTALDNTLKGIELALGDLGRENDGPAPAQPSDAPRLAAPGAGAGAEGCDQGHAAVTDGTEPEGMGEPLRHPGTGIPPAGPQARAAEPEIPAFLLRPRRDTGAVHSRGLATLSAGTEQGREAEVLSPGVADHRHV